MSTSTNVAADSEAMPERKQAGMVHPAAPSRHSAGNKVARLLWTVTWTVLCRPTPKKAFFWRRWVLRAFGARLASTAVVFPSVTVWAPWNLTMGERACLAWGVDCYNVAPITLGARATVSQRTFLCAATHDPDDLDLPLRTAPVTIGANAWIGAEVFIGPGVTIGEGAVLGARAVATKNVPPWTIAAGNPARVLRLRTVANRPPVSEQLDSNETVR